jgi:formylglycine-generating enzyme required for sulfatase activity
VLYIDEDSLTIYISGTGSVSLLEFTFEVSVEGQRYKYALDEYPMFEGLYFDQILVPTCLRLERQNSNMQHPLICENMPRSQRVTQPLAASDVFWSDLTGTMRMVTVMRGEAVLGQCPSNIGRCSMEYIPPTPTPLPTPTPTPAPTATFTPTNTPMPAPTSTATFTPTNTLIATPMPEFISAGVEPNWTPVVDEINGAPFVYVPAGCFMMGGEGGDDEKPIHEVCLSAFWISQTEVTNDQYRACVDAGVCDPPNDRTDFNDPSYASHPVVCVDWYQAETYAQWMGGSLPTEAQWEYAARGPAGRAYPWVGAEPICGVANVNGCVWDTTQVGSYPNGASWIGALDMTGNVWEWTADWYSSNYYATLAPGALDPTGPVSGNFRVLRGVSFIPNPWGTRTTLRLRYSPSDHLNGWGFRVVIPIS